MTLTVSELTESIGGQICIGVQDRGIDMSSSHIADIIVHDKV